MSGSPSRSLMAPPKGSRIPRAQEQHTHARTHAPNPTPNGHALAYVRTILPAEMCACTKTQTEREGDSLSVHSHDIRAHPQVSGRATLSTRSMVRSKFLKSCLTGAKPCVHMRTCVLVTPCLIDPKYIARVVVWQACTSQAKGVAGV